MRHQARVTCYVVYPYDHSPSAPKTPPANLVARTDFDPLKPLNISKGINMLLGDCWRRTLIFRFPGVHKYLIY